VLRRCVQTERSIERNTGFISLVEESVRKPVTSLFWQTTLLVDNIVGFRHEKMAKQPLHFLFCGNFISLCFSHCDFFV